MLNCPNQGHQSWCSQSKRQTVSQRASCKEWPGVGFYMCRKDLMAAGHQQGRRQPHHSFACNSQPAELEPSLHPELRQSHSKGKSDHFTGILLQVTFWIQALPLQSWQVESKEGSWFIQVGLNQATMAITKPCVTGVLSLWTTVHSPSLPETKQWAKELLWKCSTTALTLVHVQSLSAESPARVKL